MKDKLRTCECGHVHKEGTDMCAACGKPLTEEAKSEGVNMRYEGAAIRSKKNKGEPYWIKFGHFFHR